MDSEATLTGKSSDEAIVTLDVVGHQFTTTKDTLCRIPGTTFEGMFSGRHDNPARRKNDGSYVIDRDGAHALSTHSELLTCVGAIISLPPNAASKEALGH